MPSSVVNIKNGGPKRAPALFMEVVMKREIKSQYFFYRKFRKQLKISVLTIFTNGEYIWEGA